ncbi:MAG TPA: class II aldolase/adducin family protein [Phenylobacterium sp.]|nr:class II aldolase/adducin family protein [Phenylobacterium sp.]
MKHNLMPAPPSNANTNLVPVKERVSAEEWEARVELAALYRLVAHNRWTDTIYTHISLRTPGEEAFLINPFGYLYEEVTASSLVKVNLQGDILDDSTGLGINKAGFVIHSALHGGRKDVHCVLHTHTRAGVAVSAHEEGLLPLSQHSTLFAGRIGYHDFEGFAVNLPEQERLVANLGHHSAMILRNHGLIVAGRSAAEAFFLINALERTCEIQVAALGGGAKVRLMSPEALAASHAVLDAEDGNYSRDWAAMLRLVERIGPDYKN